MVYVAVIAITAFVLGRCRIVLRSSGEFHAKKLHGFRVRSPERQLDVGANT